MKPKKRLRRAEARLSVALDALDRIEDAARQPRGPRLQSIIEIAADTLAVLRDPTDGQPWGQG